MRIAFAASARRHRVGRTRALQVIEHPFAVFVVEDPAGRDERIVMLGDDQAGRALEVVAVRLDDDSLLVIHVMDLRPKYRPAYEEAKP